MHLDAGAVQRHCFDSDAHSLLALQRLEHFVQHSRFLPSPHAGVDRMPVAESLGQAAPFATMLGYVQHRIDYLKIGHTDVATLLGQAIFDEGELLGRDLHAEHFEEDLRSDQLVLTAPSRRTLCRTCSRICHFGDSLGGTRMRLAVHNSLDHQIAWRHHIDGSAVTQGVWPR